MDRQLLIDNWHLNVLIGSDTPEEAASLPENIPISIPGDIASALLEENLIPDPYYGRNELDCLWIGKTDWVLSTLFTAEETACSQLVFNCIDTVSEVHLNGRTIGYGRNMFRQYSFDTTGVLRRGENRLEVILYSPERYCEKAEKKLPYPVPQNMQLPWQWKSRNLLRKAACHGGWDWGITLMTGGIYEAPLLLKNFDGRITSIHTDQIRVPDTDDWILDITAEYQSCENQTLNLRLSVADSEFSVDFPVNAGANSVKHSITVNNPDLWWPAGYGKQSLYELKVLSSEEEISKKIGFRQVEVTAKDDEIGRSMTFQINGQPVFAKGANWIPVDALPSRQEASVYRRLLEDAVKANMNMIRLWGGGQYERDCFYEICNELGLMVWHDMMFSCSLYPSDELFLAEVDEEIRYQIKRLKDHPSIVLWCGNNEDLGALTWFPESRANRDRYVVDYDRLNEGVVGKAVRSIDPHRMWWPSSPSAGYGDYSDCWHDDTKGDMHYWNVWHENLPFESYYDVTPRFCSEFGFQSFPSLNSVKSFAPVSQRNITSPVMRHHQKNNAGNSIILSTIARYFRIPKNFACFLYLSQVQQAHAIRTAVEYWRAQRPVCMGALYWQLNDNWPVASWSSIEYNGNWKILHYEAKRFFSPLWLSLYSKDDIFYAVGLNDSAAAVSGGLKILIMNFQGDVLDSVAVDSAGCAGSSVEVFYSCPISELRAENARDIATTYTLPKGEAADLFEEGYDDRFVYAEWSAAKESGENEVIRTTLFLCKPRDCELADADISISRGASDYQIVLETDAPAFYVQPETSLPGRFDDSGFALIPGQKKIVQFIAADKADKADRKDRDGRSFSAAENFSDTVTVRHLRGTYD